MLAHAPRSPALIQSASYPRSASNIAPGFRSDSSPVTSGYHGSHRLSVRGERAIRWCRRKHVFWSLIPLSTGPSSCFGHLPRNRRADGRGQWKCRSSGRSHHELRREVPDFSLPFASERTGCSRSCKGPKGAADRAMGRRTAIKMPLRTSRSLTLGTPRGLFGRNGLMAVHSKSVSSYLMIRGSESGSLNHVYPNSQCI
jgi:hypothetical protein